MFPNPYNFQPQAYQLGYNPWTVQAQAQLRAAQAQLQQSQLAYNVQPTLIQQAQSAAALQQLQQQQQALTLQALQHNKYLMNAQHTQKYKSPQQRNKQYRNSNRNKSIKNSLYPKTCTICNVVCNSSLQWNMHINGKKHTKQTRGLQYQNSLQNNNSTIITSTSISHNSSLDNNNNNTTNNNNNIIKQDTQNITNIIPSDQYVVEIDGKRKCALCHVEFTSAMCEMSHIKGKRHKMAKRGHPQHFNSKKRKHNDLITLGRCELCDVDFTSQTQKDSHLTGKKHLKNVRLVDSGQPPKKRQKTNYFSSFEKNITINQPTQITTIQQPMQIHKHILPHERLQLEVERIYKEYTQIAKSSHPIKAQQVYQKYQETYDKYMKEYNLFADKFKEEQKPIKKEQNDNYEQDIDIKIEKKSATEMDNKDLVPTITTISTVKEKETENQGNEDDD